MNRFKFVCISLFFIIIQAGSIASASSFVKVSIENNISLDIPRNWVVLSDNNTITLNAVVESVLSIPASVRFQANLKDDKHRPIATVQIYRWTSELQQVDIDAMDDFDTNNYDRQVQAQMNKELSAVGGAASRWYGTRKIHVNGLVGLVSEYSRLSQLSPYGNFRVQVLRFYSGAKSFSFVVSYHEESALPLRILVDKIISTLICSKCV